MTYEEHIMSVKLALLGMGLWSCNDYLASCDRAQYDEDQFAIVNLGTEDKDGTFAFIGNQKLYPSRESAFKAAMELLAVGAERNI